jgi:hypothetical protein
MTEVSKLHVTVTEVSQHIVPTTVVSLETLVVSFFSSYSYNPNPGN